VNYAIADINGTVYSGTQAKDPLGAKYWYLIVRLVTTPIPVVAINGTYDVRPDIWQPFADAGDHVVLVL